MGRCNNVDIRDSRELNARGGSDSEGVVVSADSNCTIDSGEKPHIQLLNRCEPSEFETAPDLSQTSEKRGLEFGERLMVGEMRGERENRSTAKTRNARFDGVSGTEEMEGRRKEGGKKGRKKRGIGEWVSKTDKVFERERECVCVYVCVCVGV